MNESDHEAKKHDKRNDGECMLIRAVELSMLGDPLGKTGAFFGKSGARVALPAELHCTMWNHDMWYIMSLMMMMMNQIFIPREARDSR